MKTIVHPSPFLVYFAGLVLAPFSKPQRQYLLRLADALCLEATSHTLAALQRHFRDAPDPSNFADFLRQSPWSEQELRQALQAFVARQLLGEHLRSDRPLTVFVTFDDCTAPKDKQTHALEAVDWTFDHSQHRNCKGAVHVACRLHVGERSFPFSWRLYLRAKTVRRLNKQRAQGQRLAFRSKLDLAKEMLEELKPYLPPEAAVYVLFDRWYASAALIQFIRLQGWYTLCAIKSNRRLDGIRVRDHDKRLRHTRYARVSVAAADQARTYHVREVTGRVKRVGGRVRVIISRRHPRDKRPKYFLSTDVTLRAGEILNWYSKRWPQEVDFWYLKQELGLGDFRVQPYEAITKWYAVAYFTLTFLTWRRYEQQGRGTAWKSLAEVLAEHRRWHVRDALRSACEEVLRTGDVEAVLARYVGPVPDREAG
jgi:DDE superfamily endonuclease